VCGYFTSMSSVQILLRMGSLLLRGASGYKIKCGRVVRYLLHGVHKFNLNKFSCPIVQGMR